MKQHFESTNRPASKLQQPVSPGRPTFDVWAAAVKEQMLAVLEKKRQQ